MNVVSSNNERKLKAGEIPLQSWMTCTDGKTRGAYYVTVEYLSTGG